MYRLIRNRKNCNVGDSPNSQVLNSNRETAFLLCDGDETGAFFLHIYLRVVCFQNNCW